MTLHEKIDTLIARNYEIHSAQYLDLTIGNTHVYMLIPMGKGENTYSHLATNDAYTKPYEYTFTPQRPNEYIYIIRASYNDGSSNSPLQSDSIRVSDGEYEIIFTNKLTMPASGAAGSITIIRLINCTGTITTYGRHATNGIGYIEVYATNS